MHARSISYKNNAFYEEALSVGTKNRLIANINKRKPVFNFLSKFYSDNRFYSLIFLKMLHGNNN